MERKIQIFKWNSIPLQNNILKWILSFTDNTSLKYAIEEYTQNYKSNQLETEISKLLKKELKMTSKNHNLNIILSKEHEISSKAFYNHVSKGFNNHYMNLKPYIRPKEQQNKRNNISNHLQKRMKKINILIYSTNDSTAVLRILKLGHNMATHIKNDRKTHNKTEVTTTIKWFTKRINILKETKDVILTKREWKDFKDRMNWNLETSSIM